MNKKNLSEGDICDKYIRPAMWSEAEQALAWIVGVYMLVVISGVLFAYMDSISERTHLVKQKANTEY